MLILSSPAASGGNRKAPPATIGSWPVCCAKAVDGDRYPLSPRVRRWKAMLVKLDPPASSRVPYPAPKPAGTRAFSIAS
jgi:hypothetical protein